MRSFNVFAPSRKNRGLPSRPVNSETPSPPTPEFAERFNLWRDSLFFVAYRILGDGRLAFDAVDNCFLRACHNAPQFASGGAFGSWILRTVIDEAILLHCQHNKPRVDAACDQAFSSVSMLF